MNRWMRVATVALGLMFCAGCGGETTLGDAPAETPRPPDVRNLPPPVDTPRPVAAAPVPVEPAPVAATPESDSAAAERAAWGRDYDFLVARLPLYEQQLDAHLGKLQQVNDLEAGAATLEAQRQAAASAAQEFAALRGELQNLQQQLAAVAGTGGSTAQLAQVTALRSRVTALDSKLAQLEQRISVLQAKLINPASNWRR